MLPTSRRFLPPAICSLGSRFAMDPVEGVLDQFGSVLQTELGLDVLAVSFDGAHAQVQLACDLAGAAAFANEPEDLQFAIGELFDGGADNLSPAAGHLLQDLAFHLFAQIGRASC